MVEREIRKSLGRRNCGKPSITLFVKAAMMEKASEPEPSSRQPTLSANPAQKACGAGMSSAEVASF